MGLFGALFAGVSGLDSQSNKIGIISNNISNVNTVGYKQGQADFDTLVVPSGTTSFSPGGVIGGNQQLVAQQGTISATTSSTDVAISGGGFLVVNTKPDGTGDTYYTRSGSFTQDSDGNFVNSDGYYLQGLPINALGVTAQANSQNLKTVQVSQSATGSATSTSALTIAANLNATQATLLGSGVNATLQALNGTSSVNAGATATQILVGNDATGTNTNPLVRGDSFTITNAGVAPPDTFTYDGFAIGRSVTTNVNTTPGQTIGTNGVSTGGLGDGNNVLDTETAQPAGNISSDGTDGTITVAVTNPADYPIGAVISISGSSDIGGIPAADINGQHVVTGNNAGAGPITFTASNGAVSTSAANSTTTFAVSNRTYPFTGNILNATSITGDFMGTGGTAISPTALFTSEALKFNITVNGDTPATFQYSATPDPSAGTFNNLTTLAEAISYSPGLTATVTDGRLYVSATDPGQQVTFTNGDALGNGTLAGINWIQELDLPTQLAAAPSGTTYFNSVQSLANAINNLDPTNLVATVSNPTGASSLTINEANPEQTIDFTDSQTPANGSILTELGIANLINVNGTGTALTTGTKPIVYEPSSPATDMSSGAVTPQFSKDVTIYDSQGDSHTLAMNFVKLGTNQWAMEVTAVPASDVVSSVTDAAYPRGDGQIGSAILKFDGDGHLSSVTGTLSGAVPVNWTNGASPSALTFNLGIGTTGTGIIQSAAAFNVSTATQNGSPVGELTGVSIDQNGFVIASFSNGQTQKLYQVPLASVNNPDGLEAVSGDAYIQTIASGIANLELAGTSGVGTFTPSALEQSNVDLSTQLTDLIVAQQAYGANSKVLTVADQLLQELDQIIQ